MDKNNYVENVDLLEMQILERLILLGPPHLHHGPVPSPTVFATEGLESSRQPKGEDMSAALLRFWHGKQNPRPRLLLVAHARPLLPQVCVFIY